VLGGVVALIGLGMLCVAVVAALEPVWQLWFRLVLMAAVYLLIGGAVAVYFAKRLQRDAKPDLSRMRESTERTVQSLREELRHGCARAEHQGIRATARRRGPSPRPPRERWRASGRGA